MYYKGGNMLHTIRQVVGNDSLWRAALRGLQAQLNGDQAVLQQKLRSEHVEATLDGPIQLLQPLLTLAWSAWLLSEEVNALTLIASIAVLASVVTTQRTRVTRSSRPPLVTSRP